MRKWPLFAFCFIVFGNAFAANTISEQVSQSLTEIPIDDAKLKSSGSILLVDDGESLKLLLGVRNKPSRNEHGTLSSFHGNIIRQNGIYDSNAFDACKRNLLWELLLVDGDPKRDDLDQEAKEFFNSLEFLGVLKNKAWDHDQRPNFVFKVEYAKVNKIMSSFSQRLLDKAKRSKWPAEISGLVLIDAQALLDAIQEQVKSDNDKENLITYGKFTVCQGQKIYDALSRTIAYSVDQFSQIMARSKNRQ
jgi:hypothetical protein